MRTQAPNQSLFFALFCIFNIWINVTNEDSCCNEVLVGFATLSLVNALNPDFKFKTVQNAGKVENIDSSKMRIDSPYNKVDY